MSTPLKCPAELKPLLYDLLDPTAEGFDHEKLEQVLRDSPSARAYYLHYMQLHAELQLLGESPLTSPLSASPSADEALDETLSPRIAMWGVRGWRHRLLQMSPSQVAVLMALLFVSAGLAVLAIVKIPSSRAPLAEPTSPAAQLTATHECVWSNEGPSRDARQQFRVGDLLELESGQAELEFADGAEVVLAGPARVRIDSAGSCTLELGEAMAELPARAGGFTVHTPTAAIVDLGTSFAVAVDAAGVTEVHVFKGQVAVQPAGDDDEGDAGQMRRLSAGAALQIDDSRMFREIDCEPARFVRRTPNVAHLSAHQGGGLLRSDGGVMLGGSNDGVRRIGASSEANVSLVSVLLFRLPKLDDPSDIDAARLVFAYKSKDGDPDFAVDLYGLGHVPAAAVEPAWFFEGSVDLSSRAGYKTGSAPRQVQRISADVIGPQTRPGRVIVQSPELAEFISSLFRDGAEAGDLAVFRLNATAPTQQIPRITGYNVVHAPAIVGKTQPYEVPTLTIFTGKQAAENFNP